MWPEWGDKLRGSIVPIRDHRPCRSGHAMTSLTGRDSEGLALNRGLAQYAVELLVVGIAYYLLAKFGLFLTSLQPSGPPVLPATGLALAAVLVRGVRVWPAIFVGALVANATTPGSIPMALAVAAGEALGAAVAGHLTTLWAGAGKAFDTPSGVAKFAFVGLGLGTSICAIGGAAGLSIAGSADWSTFGRIWFTWWLGDIVAVLILTPMAVLWATGDFRIRSLAGFSESSFVQLAAGVVGLLAFTPIIEPTVARSSLSFFVIIPPLWAALRCGPRTTATAAFLLSCFAVWGALAGYGPFVWTSESLPLLTMFALSTTIPSLILGADIAVRKRVQAGLRHQEQS